MLKNLKNKMNVPVNEPVIAKESKKNVAAAMKDGWISSAGPFVSQFEEKFANYIDMKYGISVSNGTAALHIALLTAGIGQEDEVIVPAFSMGSCFMSVLQVGAKPVFVDCELETYNIDTSKISEKITSKTKAIMAVHTYGHACDMDEIMAIAKKHNLVVIEDAAEAHGGTYKGKKCGSIGDISCFSFYANKIITTGEGGMVLTNNDLWAKSARKLKDLCHSDAKRFIHDRIGYNYRLTNLQAAIGLGELGQIDKYLKHKSWMANYYNELLADIPGIKIPTTHPGVKNVFWVYAILLDPKKFGIDKNTLRQKLQEKGIGTRDFFYPPEEQPALRGIINNNEKFPNTKYASENGLYLPSGLAITKTQIKYVVTTILNIQSKNE